MIEDSQFARSADPHAWLLSADNLHEQAVFLKKNSGQGKLTRIDENGSITSWDSRGKVIFLLAGFALENAIKAFLVYENPNWISNGALSKELKSHKLIELNQKSKLIPYKGKNIHLLEQFTEAIESWARYPCGLNKNSHAPEGQMNDKLWFGYVKLINSYGRKLQQLLAHDWKGPHGISGHYKFSGDFFSFKHKDGNTI